MFPPFLPDSINRDFQDGKEEGFDVAESYIKELVKKFDKDIRKGWLKVRATTSTASNHSCNCEFCELDEK